MKLLLKQRKMPLLLLLIPWVFTGMAGTQAHAADVAVIMSAEVREYEYALEGFKDVIGHPIVATYDMEGDFGRGAEILAEIRTKVKPDLILAVGIWALQAIVRQGTDLPVVYAMVLNPPSVVGNKMRNITGASINVPVERALRLFDQLGPSIRRVGVISNPSETGFLVRQANAIARAQGLRLVVREISSSKEAVPALEFLKEEGIDALWILPDATVLAPAVLQHMLLFSYRTKVPVVGLSERHAEMGALLSLSFASSEDIGKQAGEIANRILEGRTAGNIPYTMARQVNLTVNLKAAQKLGLQLPKSILVRAHTLIR